MSLFCYICDSSNLIELMARISQICAGKKAPRTPRSYGANLRSEKPEIFWARDCVALYGGQRCARDWALEISSYNKVIHTLYGKKIGILDKHPTNMTDVRFSLFDALDHFPSDLIRQLWLLQQINTRLDHQHSQNKSNCLNTHKTIYNKSQLRRQIKVIKALVTEQKERVKLQKSQLQLQKKLRIKSLANGIISPVVPPTAHYAMHHTTSSIPSAADTSNVPGHQIRTEQEELNEEVGDDEQDNNKYCFCNKKSFGEMIACDYDKCPREWFHYKCVDIDPNNPPKSTWFCSRECRLLDKRDKMRIRRLHEKLVRQKSLSRYKSRKT